MTFNTTHVQDSLNTFRNYIIDTYLTLGKNVVKSDKIELIDGIKLLPEFNSSSFEFNSNITGELPSTLNKDNITFSSIIGETPSSVSLSSYILYDFENLNRINIKISNLITETTEQEKTNLNNLVIDYFKLIYFAANAIILYNISDKNKPNYQTILKNYKSIIDLYITDKNLKNIDQFEINVRTNKNIITNINNNFIKEQQKYSNQLQAIKDIKNQLNSLYIYIYFVITFIFVIIILSIIFRKNNNYLIIIIFILLIINALFSKYVIITENFSNTIDITKRGYDCPQNNIINNLCKAIIVTFDKILNKIDYTEEINKEIDLYTGLYNNIKSSNLNKSDKININSLTFYQYKAYTSLFLRLVILVVLLLVLYNIFGFNYIIVMLGIVLFCLILMMYLYTIKRINRNNLKIINWG